MWGVGAKLRRDDTALGDDIVSGWWSGGVGKTGAAVEIVGLQLIESGAKSGRRWDLKASCLTELKDHTRLSIRACPFTGILAEDGLCRRQNADQDSTYDGNAS